MKDIFETPSDPICVQGNNVLGDVHVGSVVKDGDEIDVKTIVVPFQREKKLNTEKIKITRKQSKPGKHEHGERKSTKEAGESSQSQKAKALSQL
ncbi:hypothetical protein Tco_0039977 [Tanacetum coccineum]